MHCNLGRAKLRLVGRYTVEEINAAYVELREKKIVTRCHQHSVCVRLVAGS